MHMIKSLHGGGVHSPPLRHAAPGFAFAPQAVLPSARTAWLAIAVACSQQRRFTSLRRALPKRYSPEEIAKVCQKRPLDVLSRCLEVIGRSFLWASSAVLCQEEELAAGLREALVELGPSFVKVGQMLSSRVDLLPPVYVAELKSLTNDVAAFSKEAAEDTLREAWDDEALAALAEVGGLPSEPTASASLGQVYRLDLEAFGLVAVKVQRPGIRSQITIDLFVLRLCAGFAQSFFKLNTDLTSLVDEYGRCLVDELDFELEAQRASAFQASLQSLDLASSCCTAEPVMELTTSTVLVTKWIHGERLEITAARDLGEAQRLQRVAMTAYLAMLLESGSLHGDPHFGNLLRAEDGRLAIIDWGLVAHISPTRRQHILRYVAHIVSGDYGAVPGDLVAMGFITESKHDAVREEIIATAISDVFRRLAAGGGAQQRISDVLPALRAVKVQSGNIGQIPADFVYILRAFSILEGHGLRLDPGYRIVDDCYPYFASWVMRAKSAEALPLVRACLYGPTGTVLKANKVMALLRGFVTYLKQVTRTASDGRSFKEDVRSFLARLKGAKVLQELVLKEAARTSEVLLHEVLLQAIPADGQRKKEDEAVLDGLQELSKAVVGDVAVALEDASTSTTSADSELGRLLRDVFDLPREEVLEILEVLWEARPLAWATQLRFTAYLLERIEQRFPSH
mmetsp:Transcript_62492/g.111055  ORF Transcript_62492/g.111055 Transcript_62492/m.111055 type:complete len:683 (+) Transcript_62492:72-2120(+)